MTGLLVKGVGGLYTIYCGGEYYLAKARGKFRKDRQKPVIGDRVDFIPAAEGDDFGAIERIYDRKNSFIRPAVANIDLLLAVIACRSPEPDLLMIDRLLIQAKMAGVTAVVVINKCDLLETADVAPMAEQYEKSGYEVFCVSTSQRRRAGFPQASNAGLYFGLCGAVCRGQILNTEQPVR